jgi:hypothetical protein
VAEQMDKLPVVILRPSIGESPFCVSVKLKHELIYHVFFVGSHKKNAYWESGIFSSVWMFQLKNNKSGRNKAVRAH